MSSFSPAFPGVVAAKRRVRFSATMRECLCLSGECSIGSWERTATSLQRAESVHSRETQYTEKLSRE